MLGDVCEPHLIRCLSLEVAFHQVVVHRWAGLATEALLLGEHRPQLVLPAQAMHPIRADTMASGT